MEIINKETNPNTVSRTPLAPKAPDYSFTLLKQGYFRLTKELYFLLDKPEYVEFVVVDEILFVKKTDSDRGYKVRVNGSFGNKYPSYKVSSRTIRLRFFPKPGKFAVFKEPITIEGIPEPLYQIKYD